MQQNEEVTEKRSLKNYYDTWGTLCFPYFQNLFCDNSDLNFSSRESSSLLGKKQSSFFRANKEHVTTRWNLASLSSSGTVLDWKINKFWFWGSLLGLFYAHAHVNVWGQPSTAQVGPRAWTRVLRVDCKCTYLRSHLAAHRENCNHTLCN